VGRSTSDPASKASLYPPHIALLRTDLPGLLAEIAAELCTSVPGYGALLEGPFGGLIRQCVHRNVATFMARAADPEADSAERDGLCHAVGRLEALNGHSMDRLQTAYRVGVQVAWRRWIRLARRHSFPTPVVLALADALFSYADEMTSLSRAGHAEERARSGRRAGEQRARLLTRLVADEPTAWGVLVELAERASWPLPDQVTPVALDTSASSPSRDLERAALDGDVLEDLDDPQPYLLIPGPMTPVREHMLARFLGTAHAAIGLTVPLSEAAHALRWARQTLAVARSAGGEDREGRPARSADHLLSLLLPTDPELIRQVVELNLAPLRGFTDSRRERLTDTLLASFSARGNVEQMARDLYIHPQTVRYRMRILHKAFGPLLDDPEWRLATELAIRGRSPVPAAADPAPDLK